jgi:hypothetical protein
LQVVQQVAGGAAGCISPYQEKGGGGLVVRYVEYTEYMAIFTWVKAIKPDARASLSAVSPDSKDLAIGPSTMLQVRSGGQINPTVSQTKRKKEGLAGLPILRSYNGYGAADLI